MSKKLKTPSQGEFIIIVALMMALVALAIDTMLPALPIIGKDLGVEQDNDNQLIISVLFLGISLGQIFYGPISDSLGRKSSIYAGLLFFIIGCVVSLMANSLFYMLLGRFIQGIGLASPRIISVALVRDKYAGEDMAKIMSLIMAVFIIMPIIAPALGQVILKVAEWEIIFIMFIIYSTILLIWVIFRMPETLKEESKHKLSFSRIIKTSKEIIKTKSTIGYTLSSGFVSGMFLGYLNSSQQIFQDTYKMGDKYALIFASLALSVGVGSILNGQILVKRFGMSKMVKISSSSIFVISIIYYIFIYTNNMGIPSFWSLLMFLILVLFNTGILFGNLNSLAMEPLGHIAGIGSTMVGALSTFISVPFGMLIGMNYDGTIYPLILGFTILGLFSTISIQWASNSRLLNKK